ncbi:MAG: helicase HerA-like domain-containing protein [Candidatus Nanopelagicales bacterium]
MTDQKPSAEELAALEAEAELAEAQQKAAEAKAKLAAARVAASTKSDDSPAVEEAAPAKEAAASNDAPLDVDDVAAIKAGYEFEGTTLNLGALVNGDPDADVQIRIPLGMLNRHGLVAGATGTGKTRTLQALAEQIAANGVPVFAADIKGDLSGVATAGESNDKLLARTQGIGQDWKPDASPTEYYSLGGVGKGVPIRATLHGFGPLLLSKVLGLNATQESSLTLVFHYADQNGLTLVDLSDLRAVLMHLTSDEGKAELANLGGLSKQTAGVILRELVTFADGGADVFFGEPEIDVNEFLRTTGDGRGIISLLEVPGVADKPVLYSTFLMYLLSELFEILPEVGDQDKPKLVFFFDEAHLLFKDASKDFQQAIIQTVRLIRSKGVGVFFVTQTPKDVPSDVLGQLGSRVQHALRAFTPEDAKALKATVGTYPKSGYQLDEVLQNLGTGEAIVTVMSEKGSPTPVAWTRLRAPQGLMSPTPDAQIDAAIAASALMQKYGTAVDPESAKEMLEAKKAAVEQAQPVPQAEEPQQQSQQGGGAADAINQVLNSKATQTAVNSVIRGLFGNGKRKR